MRNILICTIFIFVLLSCRKREYVHENDFCIYKNYLIPDTIPFDISKLTQPIDSSVLRPNKVLHLNAFNFIHNRKIKIHKVQDSLYRFLHKKYIECCTEYNMNTFGIDDFDRKVMLETPKSGCYYYCGKLSVIPKVQSFVFLTAIYEKDFHYNDLILFNVKDNKLCSLIKLSNYKMEDKEEDLEFKTFLISNKYFIAIKNPFDNYENLGQTRLAKKNGIITFENMNSIKKLSPFNYYSFYIAPNGYIMLTPTIHKLENINIINTEGQIPHKRFSM